MVIKAIAPLHFGGLPRISARLVDMMLDEGDKQDYYKISDQILRCLPVLSERAQRSNYSHVLACAGMQAFSQGAPEVSIYFKTFRVGAECTIIVCTYLL
jgi:hypothetical protein